MLRVINRKRPVGERAGMDRPTILDSALDLWLEHGPDAFSIRGVAEELGIGPTSIHSHFRGGIVELRDELARGALAKHVPPYKPGQAPRDYLRLLFRSVLQASRKQPHLGRLFVLALSKDPMFCPVFAERICLTLVEVSKKLPLAVGLQLVMARLLGMIILETSEWAFLKPQTAKTKLAGELSKLSASEFPTLKTAGETLTLGPERRAKAGYEERIGYSNADATIYEIQKGG